MNRKAQPKCTFCDERPREPHKLSCYECRISAEIECYESSESPSDIIIERGVSYWHERFGSYVIILKDPDTQRAFPNHIDPVTVAKALKAKARGPINVVVNLI